MSLFEYLVIAFALLYVSAAMRLLGGLGSALDAARRYWLHVALIVTTLLFITFSFWTLWSLNDIDWTLPRFVAVLAGPGLQYFCASVLIPENPNDVPSWRAYYASIHRRYFIGLALWALLIAYIAHELADLAIIHPSRLGHLAIFSLSTVGAIWGNERLQAMVIALLLAMILTISMTIGTQPGWLAID